MANTVEQDRHNLTHAVGECIMAWAAVERSLAVLYCECVEFPPGTARFNLHTAVFDIVVSIDARLGMVGAALTWRSGAHLRNRKTTPNYLTEWSALRQKIRDSYVLRNGIAHSDIAQRGLKNGKQMVMLVSFPTITNATKTALTLVQIKERQREFEKLAGRIIEFKNRIKTVPLPAL
jgi:hypothetical protein